MQFALVALARGSDLPAGALPVWRALWSRSPRYDEDALLTFADQHDVTARATEVRALLRGDPVPLDTALERALRAAGLSLTRPDTLTPETQTMLIRQSVAALMRQNCAGSIGFTLNAGELVLDPKVHCRNLPAGARIQGYEGFNLLSATEQALDAAILACSNKAVLTVQLADGATTRIGCSALSAATFPRVRPLIQLDGTEVSQVLVGGETVR